LRILLTGGAGFIGSKLALALGRRDHQVLLVDSLHPQVHPRGTWPRSVVGEARLVVGDVAALDTWRVLDDFGPEVVVHLAAETGTGQSLREASRHAGVNVLGTTRLLDALAASGALPARVVVASSRAVYGEGAWAAGHGLPTYPGPRSASQLAAGRWDPCGSDGEPLMPVPHRAGRTLPAPANVYGATKLAQENIIQAWCSGFDVAHSILRLQNVIGAGQSVTNSYTGVLTFFARLALDGKTIPVYEDGNIVRDFVDVEDVVDALVRAAEADPSRSHLVDIGSGHATTLLAVAQRIAELAGAPEPVVTGDYRRGDVRAAAADISVATSTLEWTPRCPLSASLGSLIDWVADEDGQQAPPAF
jgi:dTDP-L-rhamnose 4-epimerase